MDARKTKGAFIVARLYTCYFEGETNKITENLKTKQSNNGGNNNNGNIGFS